MSQTRDHVSLLIDSSPLHLPSYCPSSPHYLRVNHNMRHGSEKLYDPKVVSIGPFHHQTAHLQKMQLAYLKCLLKRHGESTVDKYVAAVRSLEEKARNSYSEPIELNTDEFVMILVLDGLFVVELLRKDDNDLLREKNEIFLLENILIMVQRDLILVENQETRVEFESSNCPHINFVGGVLRILVLRVGYKTESILRNLIVYEQFYMDDRPKYVADYTFFLQCLVNQSRDMERLRRRGIFENLLGGDEMVCPVFASLGRNTMLYIDMQF
ncbi:Plant protein of unknown function (DUF247 [Striga hermonthica]|uniref:Uncharacterized protein n=1 Tax=Striga hermonthica TaxID=68872 RepID=A0A9N7NAY3_STRHE|nr:Plant protein of unknown function (DUF247 [Striga hermonthica]